MVASIADSVVCTCNAGFYGNGIDCFNCKTCHIHAITSNLCPGGETDTIKCMCKNGYFGDGVVCAACKSCSVFARANRSCEIGSYFDTVACDCNAGYFGTGFFCTLCGEGSYSSQGEANVVTRVVTVIIVAMLNSPT
jgi:hypothetical protein